MRKIVFGYDGRRDPLNDTNKPRRLDILLSSPLKLNISVKTVESQSSNDEKVEYPFLIGLTRYAIKEGSISLLYGDSAEDFRPGWCGLKNSG